MSAADQEALDELPAPWLVIVGIGADGESGLSPRARAAIAEAELVMGSDRQLGLLGALVQGERLPWPSPLYRGIIRLLERRGRSTCVLASGDPFFFGIGATLAPHLRRGEFVCHPAPSSFSLAASRLGWSLQATELVSLHGRDLNGIRRHLQPGQRVLALSWNGDTPSELAELLTSRGFGDSLLHVLESLGGAEERIRCAHARSFAISPVMDLNVVGVELVAEPGASILPYRAALPDEAFEHDGQMTKQDVRAITLSALQPRAGARLWDVGAGSGSICIEWLLSHPANVAIAIERDAARCARIRKNASNLGALGLEVVQANAPEGLAGLSAPDAVFIGGGATHPEMIETCWDALLRGGRLVVNAVSLETEARLLAAYAELGGELRRISIESAVPLGSMTCFRPALPVVQWRITKP
jgi:precorrin-6B C5,15-methyltransferase / cobalt-precorrin-6B C5,C15-methyltransferase